MKKMLPVIIKNKRNNKDEMLQCLVDENGRFEGFAELSKVNGIISWFRQYRNKKLRIYRRNQIV